jgi:hypothetical protein
MRIRVSPRATTDDDVEWSLDAIRRIAGRRAPTRAYAAVAQALVTR